MTRPTLNVVRKNTSAVALGRHGLVADQKHKRSILRSTAEITGEKHLLAVLRQQDKLKARHQIACQLALRSGSRTRKPRRGSRKDFRSPEGFNECNLDVGRSYASRAAARMEAKKAGFPDVMRHPTTINLSIVAVTGCMKLAASIERSRLRSVLGGLSYGAQIEGMFSFVMKTAEYLQHMFPREEWPERFDPVRRPNELFALFHIHCDVSDPYLTKQQVRKTIADGFAGSGRVCVRRIQPERETGTGQRTHGGQGYLEYAALDKTEVKFDTAILRERATIAYGHLALTWTKRNRSFSMGKPLGVSGITIDPNRVAELLLNERLDWIKKNKSGEAFAEWFLHLWKSGLVQVTSKPSKWVQLGTSAKERFLSVLAIVKNWCDEDGPETPCFLGFAEPLLE